ncbi:MAG TPA: imidazolonepropionase [Candidatus Binatia bacterium]|nr:imidazolonepropionase [Candidatus Binatia bacterium]
MSRQEVDLLVHSAAQLVTCAGPGPRRGAAMRDVAAIADGAVAIRDGRIVACGTTDDLDAAYAPREELDAGGCTVCPGFVDCHTHVVHAGDRVDEFERRLAGESYAQIAASGGGILSTVRATRAATVPTLMDAAQPRLAQMLALGTTTAEVKTGYGLDTESELKLLRTIDRLDRHQPVELVPTFLAAHAVPPEYRGRAGDYAALVIGEMLPAVAEWHRGSPFARSGRALFMDVYCEPHAFDLAQTRLLLEAARAAGLPLKAHVDQFNALGGLELALGLGAVSVDHLDVATAAGIAALAKSDAIGVMIPAASFHLGTPYADARALIDGGGALALCTDFNPGSAPCPSLPMVMAIACRHQRLLPAEAVNAVTVNAAHALGLGDRVGSLEPGKQADLLVLDMPDHRYLCYEFGGYPVINVVKRGQVVR